ncbi:MAG: hypothetical protein BMS9Abin37_1748 [Acidobacteriota bacterium]|nr:MAG: hypothetical protein BMS9Abin37_1748 [Acidobacteriota bacterium]
MTLEASSRPAHCEILEPIGAGGRAMSNPTQSGGARPCQSMGTGEKNSNLTAAQVFAAIAAEVGLRTVLLKLIVHVLVHSEGAASLVAQL